IVDIDDTLEADQRKWTVVVDRARAARLGVDQHTLTQAISLAIDGGDLAYLHSDTAQVPVPVRLRLPVADRDSLDAVLQLKLRASDGSLVSMTDLVQVRESVRDQTRYRKDLLPVVYVTADVSGAIDSPLYGLAAIASRLGETPIDGQPLRQYFNSQPQNPTHWSLKWDGELQVTLDTFRDMGIAYSVGLVMIYLLVVAMFK